MVQKKKRKEKKKKRKEKKEKRREKRKNKTIISQSREDQGDQSPSTSHTVKLSHKKIFKKNQKKINIFSFFLPRRSFWIRYWQITLNYNKSSLNRVNLFEILTLLTELQRKVKNETLVISVPAVAKKVLTKCK